jgi:hypothetical protein
MRAQGPAGIAFNAARNDDLSRTTVNQSPREHNGIKSACALPINA